jgi:hypothetical protein
MSHNVRKAMTDRNFWYFLARVGKLDDSFLVQKVTGKVVRGIGRMLCCAVSL